MTVWHSWYFLFLIIPLFGLALWTFWKRSTRQSALQFSSLKIIKSIRPSWKVRWWFIPQLLKLAGITLFIVALARPQRADTKVKRNVDGIDIMVVLDVSDSMLIEDMEPINRLESSKKVIGDFVNRRVSDRIGLVIFSGESYTRVPLTLDYPLLLNNLSEVQTSRNIKLGTAIGVALANGVARLKDSKAKSRVVVLLTDGENNSGTIDPETALSIAKQEGIKIYTIGAGKDGQAQLPVYTVDLFGRKQKRYQPIHSTVNVPLLTKMASETGGRFYRADDTDALEAVFKDINRLEKTKIDTSQFTRYAELFQNWLLWAVLLYAFGFLAEHIFWQRSA